MMDEDAELEKAIKESREIDLKPNRPDYLYKQTNDFVSLRNEKNSKPLSCDSVNNVN